MIEIEEFDSFPDRTFGLGQDVAQDLSGEVEVASLFVPGSKTYNRMIGGQLRERTVDAGGSESLFESLLDSLVKQQMTYKVLISAGFNDGKSKSGREPYATGLVRALFSGQRNPAATNWAAMNYLSLTVGLGLLDFDYGKDEFTVTDLGRQAVGLYDAGTEESKSELHDFLLERLYEYPYAAWLIRLMNRKENRGRAFTKFELGAEFGFIDEAGFISMPQDAYVDVMARALAAGDKKEVDKVRSNFESTADKYMRWLAGLLEQYGLLAESTKVCESEPIGEKTYNVSIQAYKATGLCLTARNYVDGGSRHPRSRKRVRWEYLAPKSPDASKRKTIRALELKFLSESPRGLGFAELANLINSVIPELSATEAMIFDDVCGLNRIGIEIDVSNDMCILRDQLYDFIIPVKKDHTFGDTAAETIKEKIRPYLTHVDHHYLKAVDIAFKSRTSNAENTELEQLSTQLFTKEMGFEGRPLGGSSKPDGIAYTSDCLWIIDSKAYSKGFTVSKEHTDPMSRYVTEYRRRQSAHGSIEWYAGIPSDIPEEHVHFMYVSSSFAGKYRTQLDDFERFVEMRGSLMEVAKLILLAEKYQRGEIDHGDVESLALDTDAVEFGEYFPRLTRGW